MQANKGIEFQARGSRKASLRKITEKAKLALECMCCAKRGGGKHCRQETCVKACSRKKQSKKSKYEFDPAFLSMYSSYKPAEKEVVRVRKMAPETSTISHSPRGKNTIWETWTQGIQTIKQYLGKRGLLAVLVHNSSQEADQIYSLRGLELF